MLAEPLWAAILSGALLLGFLVSNIAHTNGVPFYLSRKIAHFSSGGVVAAFPFVFKGSLFPLLLPLLFGILLGLTHKKEIFHGFVRKGRLAELHFAVAALVAMAVAWQRDPWLATVPVLFIAFGDGVTGLIRFWVYKKEGKGLWGSVGMLLVCLAISVPLLGWIGIPGSLAATAAEKQPYIDDNIAAGLSALAVMVPLYLIFGG